MTAPAARRAVPLAAMLARIAAEEERLAELARELEAVVGASPRLAAALTAPERAALQRLDYLRQALEALAALLHQIARDTAAGGGRAPATPLADPRGPLPVLSATGPLLPPETPGDSADPLADPQQDPRSDRLEIDVTATTAAIALADIAARLRGEDAPPSPPRETDFFL